MELPTSYLDVDDVIEIFEALVGSASDLLRSRDLLESAVLAPQQSAFGEDAYPTIGRKRGISARAGAEPCLRRWQ